MDGRVFARLSTIPVIIFLLASTVAAASFAAPPAPAASGRASDQEPNDSQANAVAITSGEVVEGTLMLNPTSDYIDYYKISVPYGMVLNASIYMVDYDDANHSKYDFSLYLYTTGSYWSLDNSSTKNRWESVAGVQYSNPTGSATMYVAVWYGSNFQGGRYALSASVSDATDYSGGNATGTLDDNGPNGRAVYKLDPGPADDRRVLATLKTPPSGVYTIHLYNMWPVDSSWNLHNESWLNTAGHTQTAIVSGCGGSWYVIIKDKSGNGSYTFSMEELGWALDGNNIPSKAVLVRDNDGHVDYIDQGADWVDWWVVEAKANRSIKQAYASLVAGTYINYTYFNLSAFDRDLHYMKGESFPYYSGPQADLQNLTVDYDGPVYFTVRAMSTYSWGYSNFVPAHAWYRLSFELPNDPPVFSGPIPDIRLAEDVSDDGLVLSNYVTDPDNDTLSYSILGANFKSRPRINTTTGRVNFTSSADWSGSELIRFRATDDGPGARFVDFNATVTVEPVNDPPIVLGGIENITVAEEVVAVTPDIAALFKDIDDAAGNLSISLKQVSSDTHPPNATLARQYDDGTHTYRLGPARGFFGNFTLAVECTDRHSGTVPAAVRFNLTVVHKNHAPTLSDGVTDPRTIVIREHHNNSEIVVPDLFNDADMPADYAGDALTYSVTNGSKLSIAILPGGRLLVDAGDEQYYPGVAYQEKFLITAKDRAGLKATLNLTVVVEPTDDEVRIINFQPVAQDLTTSEGKKETFRVTAVDPDSSELTYAWFLDGTKDRTQTGTTYQFQPDFKMGGMVRTVRVVVSGGTNNATVEWNVTILDVNRLPTGTITQPVNFTKFKKGEFITYTAEVRDEDGDNLTLTWRDGAGKLLGTGLTISTDKLEAGTQTVRLEINDGTGSVYCDVNVAIAKPSTPPAKGFIPGYATAAVGVAIFFAAVATGALRRRTER